MKHSLYTTVLIALFSVAAIAQQSAPRLEDYPRTTKLASGVYSYETAGIIEDGNLMTTVSLFVITSDGVLVGDGQGSVAATQKMVETISQLTTQPIKYVVVCSDHGDHNNGNSAFPPGATFISSATSKATMQQQAQTARERNPDAPARIVPSEIVNDKRVLHMGGTEIQLLFLGRAHTGGDLSVYLPQEKVLFMSEAYFHRVFPSLRSGYASEWIEAIRKAQQMDARWFIPGHGFVMDQTTLRNELEVSRKALETILAEGKRLHSMGIPIDDALKQFDFGNVAGFTGASPGQVQTALRRVYAELNGELPKPQQ